MASFPLIPSVSSGIPSSLIFFDRISFLPGYARIIPSLSVRIRNPVLPIFRLFIISVKRERFISIPPAARTSPELFLCALTADITFSPLVERYAFDIRDFPPALTASAYHGRFVGLYPPFTTDKSLVRNPPHFVPVKIST